MKPKSKKQGFYYGWVITVAAWVIYLFTVTPGTYGTSVISTKMALECGWDESVIGLGSSMNFLFMALFCLPASVIGKKWGFRIVMIAGSMLGIVAFLLMFFFPQSSAMYVVTLALAGACCAMGGLSAGPAVVNNWFERNKAMPISIVATAGSFGGFVMPVVAQKLAEHNVRIAWGIYAAMCLAALLTAVFFVRNTPSEMGEVKDGAAWIAAHPVSPSAQENACVQTNCTLTDCYRSKAFYILAIQLFITRLILNGFNSYAILYAIKRGIPDTAAALLLTIFNGIGFVGRCAPGFLGRVQLPQNILNGIAFALMGSGMFLLTLSDSVFMFVLAAVLAGFGFGFSVPLFQLMIPAYFGDENFAILNGVFNTVAQVGGAAAPVIVLFVSRVFGDYVYSFVFLAVLAVLSLLLALAIPVRRIQKRGKTTV